MDKWTVYGIGGYCENCDETHDHPLHNIISETDVPSEGETIV
jgi:hypothetical protein